ncbi:MAG: DNA methyltransferase, partial [bacterium]|nr:DNA methyltransferase [bacterium]
AAIDVNQVALTVYRHNLPHPTVSALVESVPIDRLRRWNADLWWLSPPCQPFTRRGLKRDLDDPRAETLLAVLERIAEVRPTYVGFENVPGFEGSRGHHRLLSTLERAGYGSVAEHTLCPTDFGVPNRRQRYYLIAARGRLLPLPPPEPAGAELRRYLDPVPAPALDVEPGLSERYRGALDVVDAGDPAAVTSCFTSAYGRSVVRSGSYLAAGCGIRRFSPAEILRLLGFPASYRLPPDLPRGNAWRLVANSLSIPVVRSLLSTIPELAPQESQA